MEKIIITDKTRNTKALRKKIYQKALKIFEINKDNHPTFGFCYAIFNAIDFNKLTNYKIHDKFNLFWDGYVYTELFKYKKKGAFGYWFPTNKEGFGKRIQILKDIIKSM